MHLQSTTKTKTLFIALSVIFLSNLSNAQTMKRNSFVAKGSFVVDLKPEMNNKVGDVTFGRYSIQKTFQGDLNATSKVEMLSAASDNGSGAYVAIESVTGTLHGRQGTFVLMHNGTRTKTSQELIVMVVSGCSTGDLIGLEGKLTIRIVGKEHFYIFEYSL